jgi:hypothetical protein
MNSAILYHKLRLFQLIFLVVTTIQKGFFSKLRKFTRFWASFEVNWSDGVHMYKEYTKPKTGIYIYDTNRQADQPTDRQADKQAGRQTGRQAGNQAGRQTDRQTSRQADQPTDRQADRLTKRVNSHYVHTYCVGTLFWYR